MNIWDAVQNQFIEVIEWLDDGTENIVYRFPVAGQEIKMGAQLIVRESQTAVFINEGKIADVFTPGTYVLSTQNMPVLTKLKSWKYMFNSPFKAEVYFVNTKQFLNQKWGTSNPVLMRDKEFGMIRLRGYGIFSYRVNNPSLFLQDIFGTNGDFGVESISNHLKKMITSSLSDLIAESKIGALDLSSNYDELSEMGKSKISGIFEGFGLELKTFVIENLSLPEEVEKSVDKRTSIGVFGNIGEYTRIQAADAILEAAQNESGGLASAGVGLGAGATMGNIFANSLNFGKTNEEVSIACPECKTINKKEAKFCCNCGKSLEIDNKVPCIKCGVKIEKNSKFCSECGAKQERVCAKCGTILSSEAKFCGECGEPSSN